MVNTKRIHSNPRFFYLFFFLFFSATTLQAQDNKLIQISGLVTNELLQPLSYVKVSCSLSNKGTITDTSGIYSLVLNSSDSLVFSCIGYKSFKFKIDKELARDFIDLDVILYKDTVTLAEFEVYPWKNYEEFKKAFMSLKLPEDELMKAYRNIALVRTQMFMQKNPDAYNNYRLVMAQQFNQMVNYGTLPTCGLFNVVSWLKFFEAIKNGDFKDKTRE